MAKASRFRRTPAASQMRPLNETTISGTMSTGGRAAAASTPSRKAMPRRRQPASSLVQAAKRWTGPSVAPAWKATLRGASAIGFGGRLRRRGGGQSTYAQALDAPRIGVQHLELDAGRMLDELAAAWHAPG